MTYPDQTNLTTHATLKAWIDPPITTSNVDSVLDALINRASAAIVEQIPGIVVAANQPFTEVRDGLANQVLLLRRWPATAVTSVTVDNVAIPQIVTVGNSGWVLDADSNTIKLSGYYFTRCYPQNVSVVYTAGLSSSDSRLMELEHACLVTCALWWKRRPHIEYQSLLSPSGIGTQSFMVKDIPIEARMIIDKLSKMAPIFN